MFEHGGWTYILASNRNGTLYTGVTNDLYDRVRAHKEGIGSKFTRKYGVTSLVWYERHSRIEVSEREGIASLGGRVTPDWRPGLPGHDGYFYVGSTDLMLVMAGT